MNLKEKIIREMVQTDKDILIKQITKEHPNVLYGLIIDITEKTIKEFCDKCNRKKCWHKYKPYLKNNFTEFDCFKKNKGGLID